MVTTTAASTTNENLYDGDDSDDDDDGNDEEIEEHVSADNEDVIIEKVDVVGIAQEVVITEAKSEAQSDDEAVAHIGGSVLSPVIVSPITDFLIALETEQPKEYSLMDATVISSPKSMDGG
ncbi:hypothetical protein QVD17_38226 [Tagetes erecta]|uniref:Uncharacterized protein n=1 Tax=Tagetes erecta TaxID=13708 RepID=A0AAD8JVM0_TARER|nr:hypothetical protein QVD17_38226 [Tagetes erecta]